MPIDYVLENNKRLRSERMAAARKKGTHKKEDWQEMKEFFQYTCVRCFSQGRVEKDHIIPIYLGGSDGLDNIQPLCARCNCSKGPETTDHRVVYCFFFDEIMPEKYKNPQNG